MPKRKARFTEPLNKAKAKPLFPSSPNRCRKCSYTVSGKSILILLDRLFDELELLDPNSIKDYEDYLKRYANVLHQNHYLILSAKHSLCQLIGRSDGYIINELDLSQLQRKEEYCRDLLNVVNVLEPGASRLRGIICYEMHAPMMVAVTREFENRTINSNQLRCRLKEVRKLTLITTTELIQLIKLILSHRSFVCCTSRTRFSASSRSGRRSFPFPSPPKMRSRRWEIYEPTNEMEK